MWNQLSGRWLAFAEQFLQMGSFSGKDEADGPAGVRDAAAGGSWRSSRASVSADRCGTDTMAGRDEVGAYMLRGTSFRLAMGWVFWLGEWHRRC